MIDEMGPTIQGASASSLHDDEVSSLLGRGDGPDVDLFPLDGVIDTAPPASARTRHGALPTRSADLAREVLAEAEQEVRDLLAQDPLAVDWADRSDEIVARAQRQVSEILAQDRHEDAEQAAPSLLILSEFVPEQPQSEPVTLSEAEVEEGPATVARDQTFATLRAMVLPSDAGALRYRLSGQLTLATMLALQYAVSRLPGVDSARVEPEPDDVAVLTMMTNDSTLVHRMLERIPGAQVQMDPA